MLTPSTPTLVYFLKLTVTYPTSGSFIFMLCLLILRLLFSLPFSLCLVRSWAAVTLWSSWLILPVVVHTLHWFSFPCYRTFSGTVKEVEKSRVREIGMGVAQNHIFVTRV